MGININHALWLKLMVRKYNIKFDSLVMLGRQKMEIRPSTARWKKHFDLSKIIQDDGYTELFWKFLGDNDNAVIDSIDASPYENASIIMDLNFPVSSNLIEKYDAVIDSGTMEHIFNYPAALKNAMSMVRVGGILIIMTPANNCCGHGFYQFSPEMFFSVLTHSNGFEILNMTAVSEKINGCARFCNLKNNRGSGDRLFLYHKHVTSLYMIARKIKTVPDELMIQQSDYLTLWEESQSDVLNQKNKGIIAKVKKLLKMTDLTCFIGKAGLNMLLKIKSGKYKQYYSVEKELRKL